MTITIDLNSIDERCENIYKSVVIMAKRARQIHKKTNDELRKQLGEIENEEDLDEEDVDREIIIKAFDKKPKPSVVAVNEFLEGKLHVVVPEDEDED